MTRKKNNVKALALAVTCAILTGGYSGLSPVYAADKLYKDGSGSVTTISNSTSPNTELDYISIGGVTIGNFAIGNEGRIEATKIKVSNYLGVGNLLAVNKISAFSGNEIDVNGTKFKNDGTITAGSGSKIGDVTFDGNKLKDTSNNEVTVANLANTVKAVGDTTTENTLAYNTQKITYDKNSQVTKVDGKAIIGEVQTEQLSLSKGSQVANLTVDDLTAVNKLFRRGADQKVISDSDDTTGKPIIDAGNGSTVGGIKFDTGAATGVKSINDKVIFNDDGTININSKVIVGTTSSAYDENGFYAGGHSYDEAKAAIKDDGSLKAANGKFVVDGVTGETTFNGGIKTDTISEANTGAGVTVNGNKITTDNKFNDVTLKDGNVGAADITATGALKGKTLGIGSGASEFAIDANGNVTKATSITADENNLSTIGGVKLQGKKVTADTVEVNDKITTKDLKVTGHFSVGDFETNNLTVNTKLTVGTKTTLEDGTLILGTDANHTLTKDKLKTINETINNTGEINTSKATIGTNTTVNSTGINTNSITSTTGTIGGITLSGNNITGVQQIKANEFYADANNVLNMSGIKASQGTIGTVSIGSTGAITGVTTLNASDTITAKSFKASESTHLTDKELKIDANNNWTSAGITANAATIGGVNTLNTDGLKTKKVTFTNSYLSEGDLHLSDKNYWTDANGITATQAAINGVTIGETEGKATFNNSQGSTTIDGNTINTGTIIADKLLIDKISLGKDGSENITIDKDGNVSTKGDITVSGTNGDDTTVIDGAKASFGKNAANQTIIDKGNITATAHDGTTPQQSKLTHDEEGFTVAGKDANNKDSSFNFSTKTGIGTFTGQDGTTTTINGSSITSKISDSNHGVLNGSNLTLTNGSSLTKLTAGGVTYDNGTDKTVVDGGTITTETLKTNKLILGNQTGDKDIVLNADGSLSAANGAFSVDVNGRTTFKKDADNQTAINGGNIYAQAKSTSGAKSKLLHTGNGLKLTGENSTGDVKTKYEFNTETGIATIEKEEGGVKSSTNITAGGATFTKNSGEHAGTTTIDGNTIKTGHLITDKLTITGSGEAAGTGSGTIALGGDGSIKSNIKEREKDAAGNYTGNYTGKEATFETEFDHIKSEVKDGTYTAKNEVKANKIGSVITGGTVEISQTLDGENGKITNAAGATSTELSNDGFAIKQNGSTDVNIAKGDVSVTNAQTGKQVNLSDLGSLGDLNDEITSREEYTSNKTAVGAINAEAGIRREEVARLDGRINDVNDRVNKVGAMAAAIASLKSIGYDPQAPSEFSIGLGQYKGETGVAMGFFHYPNKNFMINVSLSTAGGETMGGIGATWRFGHKSPQKLLEEQREVQAKKELAAAEKYQAAAKLAKEAQERAEYAAKLARQAQVSADNAKAAADATQAKHF